MSGKVGEGDVIVEVSQPCAKCGKAAHIVMKDGRPLCASCYREERTPPPPAPPPPQPAA
ncbi:MAG TPA: hypothetical protein VFW12_10295 [Candidatus Limnocylindria bacterium]|nr:hypothetical protein [Candidatus Limnocylindria bacterium]